jgi:putative SOS response-associated peptidase YedK
MRLKAIVHASRSSSEQRRHVRPFTLRTPLTVLPKQFQFDLDTAMVDVRPRYSIAPTQTALAVWQIEPGAKRKLAQLFWGLVPSWAKDNKSSHVCINARGDAITTKPTFRAAFKKRRCLVLADGYYEWHTEGKEKQPFLFELDGGKPFVLAGIWEAWHGPNRVAPVLESCALMTTDANEVGAEVQDRMPVTLAPADYDRWLNSANEDTSGLQSLLHPFPADTMTARPVSRYVSNARHEGEECIAPP